MKNKIASIDCIQSSPKVHFGMFQDSVLCIGNECDIRYFPMAFGVETYSTSHSGTGMLYIMNVGTSEISVNKENLKCNDIISIKNT